MISKLCCIIIAIISIPLASCGGNGSSSNSYGSTSDYPSTTEYNEPTQPQYYPCPECNSTGYMKDYSGISYPCVKCGGNGMIKIGGGSQPSFTGIWVVKDARVLVSIVLRYLDIVQHVQKMVIHTKIIAALQKLKDNFPSPPFRAILSFSRRAHWLSCCAHGGFFVCLGVEE